MKKRGWQGLGLGSILICLGHVGLDPVFVQFASVGDPDQPKGGSVAVIMPGFDKTLTITINIRYPNYLFVMVDLGMRETVYTMTKNNQSANVTDRSSTNDDLVRCASLFWCCFSPTMTPITRAKRGVPTSVYTR